jgi:hypothetical protein
MAVTRQQLCAEFPEFASTSIAIVEAKLGEAALRCNAGEYGALHDLAIKQLACHLIAMSPGGEFARIKYPHLEQDGAATIYERTFNAIRRDAVLAATVV